MRLSNVLICMVTGLPVGVYGGVICLPIMPVGMCMSRGVVGSCRNWSGIADSVF